MSTTNGTPAVHAIEDESSIDAREKTIVLAAEPPANADWGELVIAFAEKLRCVLKELEEMKTPFKFVEGFRTEERQQWLYGSGRPNVTPFGRHGPIVTNRDGVKRLSNHQGNGTPGSGRAADCYPIINGRVCVEKVPEAVWKAYADLARKHGLDAGYYWTSFKDSPHCELPSGSRS